MSYCCISVNCSDDDQNIIVWPNSFKQIRLNQILHKTGASPAHVAQAMSWFQSEKTFLEIPKYGCVVFPSDTLHAGAENPTDTHLFRGFCVLRKNGESGHKSGVIHHIEDTDLMSTMKGLHECR